MRVTCIGNDPGCPCQDGDACHYRDIPGSPAWPLPQVDKRHHPNPQLHRLLAICPMGTPPLSALLHRHERTVRRWVKGQYPLDDEMAAWLAHLCEWLDTHPAPHGGSRDER